jgi:Protein of unknown function (DUF4236)
MGFRFRRSVRVLPGLRLNFSPRGLSATVGVRGLNIGVGRRGTHLNVGLPGTGLSLHQRLGAGTPARGVGNDERAATPVPAASLAPALPVPAPAPTALESLPPGAVEVRSAAVEQLGSEGMAVLTDLLREAAEQQHDAAADLEETRRLLEEVERRCERAQRSSFVRWVLRARVRRLEQAVKDAREDHAQAQRRYDTAPVDVDFALETAQLAGFDAVIQAFATLARAAGLWDVTTLTALDQRTSRSNAPTHATGRPVRFAVEVLPAIRSRFPALRLGNANGEDVRLLPAIALVGGPTRRLAVLDLSIACREVTCTIDEPPPADTKVIGSTWAKVNKDGGPDRRFTQNPSFPSSRTAS